MEYKHLDLQAPYFEAKGIKYYPKNSVSVERYRWFEKYQNHFGWGKSFDDIYKSLKSAIELGNKGKGIEAWNIILNLMQGIGKNTAGGSVHPAFLICALFIVTEDEDLTQWDEVKAEEKIKNWNDEGYDANDFFRLAANLVTNYINDLEEVFQDFSKLAAVQEAMKSTEEPTP